MANADFAELTVHCADIKPRVERRASGGGVGQSSAQDESLGTRGLTMRSIVSWSNWEDHDRSEAVRSTKMLACFTTSFLSSPSDTRLAADDVFLGHMPSYLPARNCDMAVKSSSVCGAG